MKIAHVSDIHIRNLKFHQDYRHVFDDFYQKLQQLGVELVVNTGDTAHAKTNISPEFVSMTSDFFAKVAEICPIISILGNHDLNLMNRDREDAITPIVEALNNPRIVLLKKSGMFGEGFQLGQLRFWNFGIDDAQHWPRPPFDPDCINIGLFHGSIKNCITDSNFRMTNVEYDVDIFGGLDFVMMGDIHKRQSFNGGRIWYAGSMIQQNFGEDPEKGFLVWDIRSKEDFGVTFHELAGNRKFYTIQLSDDLAVPDVVIDRDSRIRISPPRALTLVEQRAAEKIVRKKYDPHDVITLGPSNIGQQWAQIDSASEKIENVRRLDVQERLLHDFFKDDNITQVVMDRILELNRKYQVSIDQKDDVARDVRWKIMKMSWNNVYNYGEENVIDFSQIRGLTGIFAPNAAGKSGMIDVITIGMFDCNTKEVMKNVHLINDNKDNAAITIELMADDERYTIARTIDRVKYGQKKGDEREWGKTSLDFIRHDPMNGAESLVGELRPQTEAAIRRRFGSFDDFMLTSLSAQWDPMDIIMVKETERKRILFRFLDLDIFEEKGKLAREELKPLAKQLQDLEENDYETLRAQIVEQQDNDRAQLNLQESIKTNQERVVAELHTEIERMAEQIVPVGSVFRKIEPDVVAKIERQLEDTRNRRSICDRELITLGNNADDLEKTINDRDVASMLLNIKNLEEAEMMLFSVLASIKEQQRRTDDRRRQVLLLENVPCGDKFPSCQFLVDAFRAKNELLEHGAQNELKVEESEFRRQIVELEPNRENYRKHLHDLENLERLRSKLKLYDLQRENARLTIEKLELELAKVKFELERYAQIKRDVEQNEMIQRRIGELREKLVSEERGFKLSEKSLVELHQRMGARGTDIERLTKQLRVMEELRDTCHAFEKFSEAMGKDGIALRILTQKLPLINDEINKILAQAAEFGMKIEYNSDEQSIRLLIQYGQYKSRLLELGSGAEKFLASVAIRAALLSISNLPRSNLFIADEGFGKLDPWNMEAVSRMFDYLRSIFDHVVVISHLDVMKDMVDNIVEITADDEGYAHVKIGV